MPRPHIADDGWISTRGDEFGDEVHVRVRWDKGQFVVTDILISAPDITAATLRRIQPARIVAEATAPAVDAPPLDPFAMKNGEVLYQPLPDDAVTLGELRKRQPIPRATWKREPLGRPDGTNTDEFYVRVALAYMSAAAESNAPVTTLANEADVPAETVRRWVKEARRRRLLPAGRKGRAG